VVIYPFKDVDGHKLNQHLLFLNKLLGETMENKMIMKQNQRRMKDRIRMIFNA
jgi:hypothetical protein